MSRFIPYGYQMKGGEYVISEEQAAVVRRIYALYADGLSYDNISASLNRESICYKEDHPGWNKNLIKRILENPKYTGTDPYPAIISEAEFHKVRDILAMRNANRTVKTPADDAKLWKYITCGACGGKLYRTGQRTTGGSMVMNCRQCDLTLNLPKEHLKQEVLRQYLSYMELPKEHRPSDEVNRIENEINRALENPEEPQTIIDLILQGISARYDCCTPPLVQPTLYTLKDINWRQFAKLVSAVSITPEMEITIVYKEETARE